MLPNHVFVGRRRERGVALLLVIVAVAVAALVSLAFVSRQAVTLGVRENAEAHARAKSVAESGIRLSLRQLSENDDWLTDGTGAAWSAWSPWRSFTLGTNEPPGQYRVKIELLPPDRKTAFDLVAEGSWGGAVERVRVSATPYPRTGTLLMIVGALPLVDPHDLRMVEMFQTWGYSVGLLSDDTVKVSSAAQMQMLTAGADVIYVSTSVASGDVGTKLNAINIGAVTTETQLNDEWGFSSGYSDTLPDTDKVNVLTTAHPITSGVATGNLTLTERPAKLRYLSGTFASGATWLARHPTDATYRAIGTLEKGATGYGGVTAPHRRVILPWSTNADPSWLTTGGQELLRRALEWASITPSTTVAGYGGAVTGSITANPSARVDAVNSNSTAYNPGTTYPNKARLATNATTSNSVYADWGAMILADIDVGPGGGSTTVGSANGSQYSGTVSKLSSPMTFSAVATPTGLPAVSSWTTPGSGTVNLAAGTYRYAAFGVGGSATVNVAGNATIWVNGEATVSGSGKLNIAPGSTLNLYCQSFTVTGSGILNATTPYKPGALNVYVHGTNKTLTVDGSGLMIGNVYAPTSTINLTGSGKLFGTFTGKSMTLGGGGRFTHDLAQPGFGGSTGEPDANPGPITYRYLPRWTDQR